MLSCLLNNKRINCVDGIYDKDQLKKWAKKKILLCPICNEPYEYCHGKVKIPYFRHMYKEDCLDNYSEPETEEHLLGKQDLYEWIKVQKDVTECTLEGWIPETKQRPDIMFKYKGELCVIEYQCSPISTEYIYQSAGIKDVWICGTQNYFQCYHTGTGQKRINLLEENSHLYYDSTFKKIFRVEPMSEEDFENITINMFRKKIKHKHLMKNFYDYREGMLNYFLIKDENKSYKSYNRYPSPTGRPSRKYPYPVKHYVFKENKSLTKCMDLKNLKIKSIN